MSTPVIVEAAINGVTVPERNASVPRSPAEIAVDVVRCLAAGAAIVHSHARRVLLADCWRRPGAAPRGGPSPVLDDPSLVHALSAG